MRVDKKARAKRLRFVVLAGLARPASSTILTRRAARGLRRGVPVKVLVLSGPNLDRLGVREPEVYGRGTYPELVDACRETAAPARPRRRRPPDRRTRREMIRWLHEAADERLPVVLNAGAWTHYSYALRDALRRPCPAPLIEVHLSQIAAREEFRHHSVLSAVVTGTITGLGVDSYLLALHAIAAGVRRLRPAPNGPAHSSAVMADEGRARRLGRRPRRSLRSPLTHSP